MCTFMNKSIARFGEAEMRQDPLPGKMTWGEFQGKDQIGMYDILQSISHSNGLNIRSVMYKE